MPKREINSLIQQNIYRNNLKYKELKRVIVDKNKKLIFNRIRKNANTFITTIIYLNSHASNHENIHNIKHGQAKHCSKNLNDTLILENLTNYSSLLVIRQPHIRLLSAFLQKFNTERYASRYGNFELTGCGFENFVSWLQDGGLDKNPHWDLQSREIVFDFDFYTDIIRFEDLKQQFPLFLARAGYDVGILKDKKIAESGKTHKTNSTNLVDEFYTPIIRKKVDQLYQKDLELFSNYY